MFKRFLIIFSLFIVFIPKLNASPQQSGSLSKIVKKTANTDTSTKSESGSLKNIVKKQAQNKKQPSLQENIKQKKLPSTSKEMQSTNEETEGTSNLLFIIIGVLAFIVVVLMMRKGGGTTQTEKVDIAPENTDANLSTDTTNKDSEENSQAEERAQKEEEKRLAEETAQKEKEIREYYEGKIEIDDDEFTGTKKVTMKLQSFIGDQLSDKYNDNWPYSLWMFLLVKVDKKFTIHAILTTKDWWFVDEKNSLSIITDKMGTISLSTIRNDRDTTSSGVQEYMIYDITEEQLMAIRDTKGVIKARFTCNNHGSNYDNFWNYPNPETVDDETIEKLGLHSYFADYSVEDIGGHTSLISMQDRIRYFLDNHGENNEKSQLEKPHDEEE